MNATNGDVDRNGDELDGAFGNRVDFVGLYRAEVRLADKMENLLRKEMIDCTSTTP